MESKEIRNNVRSNVIESRQLSREKVLGSKRKALQDVINIGREVTDGEVILVGNKIKSKSAVQVADLALLKLAFVQNENNILAFLKVKGALQALVRELSSGKSNYQLVAAECCCNLALGDSWSCLQVAKAAGPYLIAVLSGFNCNLINVSVWALGNLAGSDEKTWQVLHSQGFLPQLLHQIQAYDRTCDTQTHFEIQQNSLNALVQLLLVGSKLLTAEEVERIAKTIGNLNLINVDGLQVSEFLLSALDAAEGELLQSKVHLKCLNHLVKTDLNDENLRSFTAAVRTIANLVSTVSGACCLELFVSWNLFQEVVQKIFASPYPHLVKELGWLLGNIMNHPSPQVQQAVEGDLSCDFQLYNTQFSFLHTCD